MGRGDPDSLSVGETVIMWQQLLEKVFGALKVKGLQELLHQLESFVKPYVANEVSHAVGTVLVDGVNAVVAAAVNTLDKENGGVFAHAYVEQVDHDIAQLVAAFATYIPLQFAVEEARKEHGVDSPEAHEAATKRDEEMKTVQSDAKDLILEVFGLHP